MDVFQFNNSLQFHANDVFDKEIRSSGAYVLFFVIDRHLMLTAEGNVLRGHFDCECSPIDYFLKSITQHRMHRHGTADDLARQC